MAEDLEDTIYKVIPLTKLKYKEEAEVHSFHNGRCFRRRLENMGIREKTIIKRKTAFPFGPQIYTINNSYDLALGCGEAEKILVKYKK